MNKERVTTGDKMVRQVSLPGMETVVRQPRTATRGLVNPARFRGKAVYGPTVVRRGHRQEWRAKRQASSRDHGRGVLNDTVEFLRAQPSRWMRVHQPGRKFGPPPASFAYKALHPGAPGARAGGLDGSERVAIYSRRRRGGMPLRELTPRQAKRIRKWQTRHGGFGVQ